jgi:hypothetical protein
LPAVVRKQLFPIRKIVGNLSDTERVLAGLDLRVIRSRLRNAEEQQPGNSPLRDPLSEWLFPLKDFAPAAGVDVFRSFEGYMGLYWKSPELLVVVDAEQFNGWQQLHDSYINGYPDRSAMGFIQPKRIQVKLLKPDLDLALTWWSVAFPSFQAERGGK